MRPSRFRPSYSEVIGEGGVSTIGELSRGGSNRMPVLMTATVGAAFLSLDIPQNCDGEDCHWLSLGV